MTVPLPKPLFVIVVGALSVLSGGLLAIGYSNDPIWWTAWLAPAPALAAMLIAPERIRTVVGLLIGFIAGALSFRYRVEIGSVAAAVVIAIAYALGWSSTLKLAAIVAERLNALMAALVLPITWAAVDTLLIHLSPHGSMGSIAYSQGSMLSVQQLASLGGVPLITFVALLPGSVAGLALARAFRAKTLRLLPQAIGFAAVTCGAALLFGEMRLNAAPLSTGPVVIMITANKLKGARRDWPAFVDTYGTRLERAARSGVTILLPEKILRLDQAGLKQAQMALSTLARERAATIVMGIVVDDGEISTNRALALFPDGSASDYVKQHLVPVLEGDLADGSRDLLVRWPAPGTGVAICKDMHFPTLGRRYASEGARLMLVPALDFDVDAEMMMRVAAIRGIEGGYTVARTARDGMSAVTDPYGRILAKRRNNDEIGQLVARIPQALIAPPPYTRIGDLFGWSCLLAWLGIVVFIRRKRAENLSVAD